jgi:hypothetical protein
MFDGNPYLDAMVESVMAFAAGLSRGDVLHMERIEHLTGLARYTTGWVSLIKKLKRRMEDARGISFLSVRDVGYKLCTLDENIDEVNRRGRRKAFRALRRAKQSLQCVPAGELSTHQSRRRALYLDKLDEMHRGMRRAAALQRAEMRSGEQNPIRPRETTAVLVSD